MGSERLRRILHPLRVALVVASVAALAVGAGYVIPHYPKYAVLATAVIGLVCLSVAEPALLALVLLPLMLVIDRVPGVGANGVSVSDVALAVAAVPAVLLAPRPFSRELRLLLWLNAGYLAAFAIAVVANPFRDNVIEWSHELVLTMGALLVGWAIGARGLARAGCWILLASGAALATAVLVTAVPRYVRGDFSAVEVNFVVSGSKNYLGTAISFVAVICASRPPSVRLGRLATPLLIFFCVSVGATQSRQAVVGLAAALLVVMLRRGERRRSVLLPTITVPAIAISALTLREQLTSDNRFNSAHQRISFYRDTLTVWRSDPLFGAGQRWWYTNRFSHRFQPPNAELEVLSTTGLLGLAAFTVLTVGTIVVLRRVGSPYGTLALAVFVDRIVQGQLDIFWLSVTASLPLLIVGICLGAVEHETQPRAVRATDARPAEVVAA